MECYEAMIEAEELLIENLSEANEVDGHDAGAEEVNIFIRTDNPEGAFNEVRDILGTSAYWVDARAAYREVLNNEYTILWPEDLTKFKVL